MKSKGEAKGKQEPVSGYLSRYLCKFREFWQKDGNGEKDIFGRRSEPGSPRIVPIQELPVSVIPL
jgi:hypothetical protein